MLKKMMQGFTVVELIIVIAVIGILVSIGVVSWGGAQSKAKKSAAESVLSQVKLKIGEYYTDNNVYPFRTPYDNPPLFYDKDALCDAPTYSVIPAGTLYNDFCGSANYQYYVYRDSAMNAACDNGATKCTYYRLIAHHALWNANPAGHLYVYPN